MKTKKEKCNCNNHPADWMNNSWKCLNCGKENKPTKGMEEINQEFYHK